MVKLLFGGVWICAVTIASVYVASSFSTEGDQAAPAEPYMQGIDYVKTRQITVPKVANGQIAGYVLAQFVFTADAATLRQLSVPLEIFVIDEAFRAIYADDSIDFASMKKTDLSSLTAQITQRVNERVQVDLVQETLVDHFNYVSSESLDRKMVMPTAGK